VMVCVAINEDGSQRVVNVVIGEEPEDIHLARNTEGQPLVFDEQMELLEPGDITAHQAIRDSEEREWPNPDEWEGGPDALRFPGLYDPVELDEVEDFEPLDLKGDLAVQA
nr:hypothetical protein [Longispora sp. (in: high G+C Gram-positive bacteria)]